MQIGRVFRLNNETRREVKMEECMLLLSLVSINGKV